MTEILMCSLCEMRPQHSRTLCTTCYQAAYRSESLDDYPTTRFLDNPDAYVRWAFGYTPELIGDIAVEFGYELVKIKT